MVTARPSGARTIDEMLAAARARLVRLTPREAFREWPTAGCSSTSGPPPSGPSRARFPGPAVIERNHLEWRLDPC